MRKSVLEAIREGDWEFEPPAVGCSQYVPTKAMPGSEEKVVLLAERIAEGLPLWHPDDRQAYDDSEEAYR